MFIHFAPESYGKNEVYAWLTNSNTKETVGQANDLCDEQEEKMNKNFDGYKTLKTK